MAIRIPAAPAQSLDALRSQLPSLANRSAMTGVAPRLRLTLPANALPPRRPVLSYPVYTLGLSELPRTPNDRLSTLRNPRSGGTS